MLLCSDQILPFLKLHNNLPTQLPMDYDARKESLQSEQQSEKVQIYFSCKNVEASAVYLEVYLQETNKPRKKLLTTKNQHGYNQTIDFPESLILDYFFEVRQKLLFNLFNSGSRELIGEVEATVGQIFNGRNKGIIKQILFRGGRRGNMVLRCQKVERGSSKYIEFDLSCNNLDVSSFFLCFCECGSHFKLYKLKNNEEYLLYQSEVRDGKATTFNHVRINQKRLCNNNPKQPLIVRFFNDGGNSLIGEARLDLATLTEGRLRHTLMKRGNEKGVINFQNFKQTVKYDFMDFLSSGMQMAMVVCIDFTASNGIQSHPSSLHYTTVNQKSHYEEALNEVCSIVLDYDTDKLVPTFGFGAKVNLPGFSTGTKVHHCFPINGQETNPNLFQLSGILQGYRQCLSSLSFSGPTLFAPLLREAMSVCENMKAQLKQYMILLILTDGIIHDLDQVKDLLVKCGKLPLSVIIIGIGNGQDWGAMNELDDDDCLMTDFQGNKTQRDLVQFVQFSKHNNNGVELAREVLEELPRQVEQYHQLVHITPEQYKKNLGSDSLQQRSKLNPYD